MTYRIEIEPIALKALARLQKAQPSMAGHVASAINDLAYDPYRGKPLVGDLYGFYSLRVGVYRVVYSIDKGRVMVQIIHIGHRKDAYR
ncbi:MAG: type II toxin-antitoxin system RelE/ParE family toxin [Candidatus Omnitrophica bacterium]|nr:type II toxin-antitoxin system RelE/ParE family toxin [Candidatus Omnitrophota bacterium]